MSSVLKPSSWLNRRRGEWRMWWNQCPMCNSDAPAVDTCRVCYDFLREEYPPSPLVKWIWWKRWINLSTLAFISVGYILLPTGCSKLIVSRMYEHQPCQEEIEIQRRQDKSRPTGQREQFIQPVTSDGDWGPAA